MVLPSDGRGAAFFCIARILSKDFCSFFRPASIYAIGLGCEAVHAPQMVYSNRVSLAEPTRSA
jgi:predicted transcriptional regulator